MINLKEAQKIVEGCLKKAREEEMKPITIAVLDTRGILVSSAMEIRSTIPPQGYLVLGNSEKLKNLRALTSVESVHEVASWLLIHPVHQDARDDENLVVEIDGWKN